MPAWVGVVPTVPPLPAAVASPPASGATPLRLTVLENSAATVIDLRAVYTAVSGLQQGNGLKLSILGNSNSGLVGTKLSEAALTLTYTRGKCGTATITLCATDADGVSVKQSLVVTVQPLSLAGMVPVSPLSVGRSGMMPPGPPR
jgi:hypothetical protein